MGKIVVTNGCFDCLHVGHINLLLQCRELAGPDGKVFVGIDSDQKIKTDKGKNRPFFTHYEREEQLYSLGIIDSIFVFDTNEQLYNDMYYFHPDIIVKGEDWKGKEVIGSDLCSVFLVKKKYDISTTELVERIKSK